jgi:hypothetical protein
MKIPVTKKKTYVGHASMAIVPNTNITKKTARYHHDGTVYWELATGILRRATKNLWDISPSIEHGHLSALSKFVEHEVVFAFGSKDSNE